MSGLGERACVGPVRLEHLTQASHCAGAFHTYLMEFSLHSSMKLVFMAPLYREESTAEGGKATELVRSRASV